MTILAYRGSSARLRQILPLLLFFLICACNDSPDDNQISEGIEVIIDNQISQQIQVISSMGTKAGKVNPVEVQITLKNTSKSHQQVLWEARWLDSKGGSNGGSQRVLKFAAGQSQVIKDGTRFRSATSYAATLTATQKSQDQLLTEMLASEQSIAGGQGMTFSSTPASEHIPNWSVRGVANGRPFDAKTIIFRTLGNGQWRLAISDRAFDPVNEGLGVARTYHADVQTVNISLSAAPGTGKVFQQEMQYGGGMFQIKPSADSEGTTSWNTSLAYIITITNAPDVIRSHSSCGRPKPGKISGTLYISFQGSEEQIKSSWISGTFTDAVILYCGDP